MKKYMFIGLGGTLGAILRFIIKNIEIYNYKDNTPLSTFIINITGSFILAFILTMTYETWQLNEDIKLGITTGFLGAYTTFSTMCKETVIMLNQGYYFLAISYIGFSVMLGLTFAYLGIVMAKGVVSKRRNTGLKIPSNNRSKAEGRGV